MTAEATIGFRRIEPSDFTLLHDWLALDHVRAWWGDPDVEIGRIRAGEATGETEGYIGCEGLRPVSYLQTWRAGPEAEAEWLYAPPEDAVGIDMFIGPADCLGRGLGPRLLRAFAERLHKSGARRLLIDPDSANSRAIRACIKAGFHEFARVGWSGDTVLMMFRSDGNP